MANHISSGNGKLCAGEVVRCEDFPTPDDSCLMTWHRLYGSWALRKARENPGKLICLNCFTILSPPEEDLAVWGEEFCPI